MKIDHLDIHELIARIEKIESTDVSDLKHVLASLLTREALIIGHRFGLLGNSKKTLKQIGELLKLSSERVRAIESKAIRKLRHASRKDNVKNITHLALKKKVLGENFESES